MTQDIWKLMYDLVVLVLQMRTSLDVSAPLFIELNMLPADSFMSCLDSLLGYFTGEFRALQLIVFAVFGAMD